MLSRRHFFGVAGAAAGAGALAACGNPTPPPAVDPGPSPSGAAPAIGPDQYQRILTDVAETVSAADAALDPDILAQRVGGTAFANRAAQYEIARQNREIADLPGISAESLLGIVSTEESFPRSFCAITADPNPDTGGLGRYLVLRQDNARDDYTMWGFALQVPGTRSPVINNEQTGNAPVPPDAEGLRLTPQDAAALYLNILTNGQGVDTAGHFADDAFRQQQHESVWATRAQLDEGVAPGEVATIRETFSPVEGEYAGFATADGGAIVCSSFSSDRRIDVADDATLTYPDQIVSTVLGGMTEFSTYLSIVFAGTMVLHVPAADATDQQAQCIGIYKMLRDVRGE